MRLLTINGFAGLADSVEPDCQPGITTSAGEGGQSIRFINDDCSCGIFFSPEGAIFNTEGACAEKPELVCAAVDQYNAKSGSKFKCPKKYADAAAAVEKAKTPDSVKTEGFEWKPVYTYGLVGVAAAGLLGYFLMDR